MSFLRAIGWVVLGLFAIEVVGCAWVLSQHEACPDGYDPQVQGCKGMPKAGASLSATDAGSDG